MYTDKIFKALNEYDSTVTAVTRQWAETRKQLNFDYSNGGRIFDEKYAAGKALYEKALAEAQKKGTAIANEEFAKIHETVRTFISVPVPNDFISTLEAIKATGKDITDEEAGIYLEKYKTNYIACRSLSQNLQELTGKSYFVVVYDAVKKDIEEVESYVRRIFTNTMNGYIKALFTSEQHSPLLKLDAALADFMTKDVRSYATDDETQG